MVEDLTKTLPMLPPGATIGMLGGGQLGRMSLLAGRRLGYRFVVLEPSGVDCPAGAVADEVIVAPYDDPAALDELARRCDRITLEFENIPAHAVGHLARQVDVCPGGQVLEICQHRQREKEFLREAGFPCAPFAVVHSLEALREAVASIGAPCVLKSAAFGYDGKGQVKIDASTDLKVAWSAIGHDVGVVEKWITFEGEFSVVCARNAAGAEWVYPVFENEHRNHILDTTLWPARLSPERAEEAVRLGRKMVRKLGVVGLLTVELFLTSEGWLVNEMAPRPHNSGHITLDAALTSQFEQHIRAVANLPLGDPSPLRCGVMVNLLGDRWPVEGKPDWSPLFACPQAKLHLYGKSQARLGRKMGHFTVLDESLDRALATARQIDAQLPRA
jgi:5-(carboxyamino)imidazole ribonucleotide synthase